MNSQYILKSLTASLILILIGCIRTPQSPSDQILYFANDDKGVVNLWLGDLSDPEHPEKLTFYEEPTTRILHHQISNDGRYVVFMPVWTATDADNEIMLLDLQTHNLRQLTRCREVRAGCSQFSIRPDGRYVTYYQFTLPFSIRLIDLATSPPSERLIDEFEWDGVSYSAFPRWVGDTGLLVYGLPQRDINFEPPSYTIQLYDVTQNKSLSVLPLGTALNAMFFSPDGTRYAYYGSAITPQIFEVRETDNQSKPLYVYYEEDWIEVKWVGAVIYDWHPDNERLLFGTIHDRYIPYSQYGNYAYSDIGILNTITGDIEFLTHDDDFSYLEATWNPAGTKVLYERADPPNRDANFFGNQFMIFDMESGETRELPIFGSSPRWVGNAKDIS
jgi:Tol biopolymer transport system component